MFTRCPHCATVYPISAGQLRAAGGRVRCGRCGRVFQALDELADEPGALWARPPRPASRSVPPSSPSPGPAAGAPKTAGPEMGGKKMGGRETGPPAEERAVALLLEPPAEGAGRPREEAGWGWVLLNAALALLLLAQVAYAERGELAQRPAWRPWLEMLCAAAGCSLPPRRDLQRLVLEERRVEADPRRPGVLVVEALLANEAGFAQPYPLLELRFTDLQGRLVAGRRFRPREYLPPRLRPGEATRAFLGPGQAVRLRLRLRDPGPQAVNYSFALL
ncbi:MAG: DUF3426 domain-containing protein [Gammaproteobacteria bacterium]|nr:MAG: DUF3426 domain-containing protein [Gammaproteobacteria bacterium]